MTADGTYTYTYDANGNEIGKRTPRTGDNWTYSYDDKNEMISAVDKTSGGTVETSAVYKYDAFGNRTEKDVTISGTATVTKFIMDGWKNLNGHLMGNDNWDVLADLNSSGTMTTRYLRGNAVDQIFAELAYNGSTFTADWTLTDIRGSVRDIINNAGTVQDSISYSAFGKITSETNSANRGRYAWSGRELDVETGLQYNRAHYYDSNTGRWQSQDPLGFAAGDSNLYRYVHNQPTDYSDPSGLEGPLFLFYPPPPDPGFNGTTGGSKTQGSQRWTSDNLATVVLPSGGIIKYSNHARVTGITKDQGLRTGDPGVWLEYRCGRNTNTKVQDVRWVQFFKMEYQKIVDNNGSAQLEQPMTLNRAVPIWRFPISVSTKSGTNFYIDGINFADGASLYFHDPAVGPNSGNISSRGQRHIRYAHGRKRRPANDHERPRIRRQT